MATWREISTQRLRDRKEPGTSLGYIAEKPLASWRLGEKIARKGSEAAKSSLLTLIGNSPKTLAS